MQSSSSKRFSKCCYQQNFWLDAIFVEGYGPLKVARTIYLQVGYAFKSDFSAAMI